jgi:hypothetical protein
MSAGKSLQINVLLGERESVKFLLAYKATIYRSRAAYARKLLLGKPVTVITRNRSLDDFIETAVRLRRDLRLLLSKEGFTVTEKELLRQKMSSIEENLIQMVNQCKQN